MYSLCLSRNAFLRIKLELRNTGYNPYFIIIKKVIWILFERNPEQ